jgi:hypothetical protein
MTPKEKAKELFLKCWKINLDKESAKQCALIAVDEIINSIEVGFEDYKSLSKISFWQEVELEIKKL